MCIDLALLPARSVVMLLANAISQAKFPRREGACQPPQAAKGFRPPVLTMGSFSHVGNINVFIGPFDQPSKKGTLESDMLVSKVGAMDRKASHADGRYKQPRPLTSLRLEGSIGP